MSQGQLRLQDFPGTRQIVGWEWRRFQNGHCKIKPTSLGLDPQGRDRDLASERALQRFLCKRLNVHWRYWTALHPADNISVWERHSRDQRELCLDAGVDRHRLFRVVPSLPDYSHEGDGVRLWQRSPPIKIRQNLKNSLWPESNLWGRRSSLWMVWPSLFPKIGEHHWHFRTWESL